MVHESTMVMNMCSDLGHMLSDESYCPEGVTQEDLMEFLTSVILEYESSFELKNSNLDEMKSDINDYFNDCTLKKKSLVEEEVAEAVAEATAGAAMIVSAALSLVPGVSFAVSAYELAAEAAALALQIESEKLEKTLVEKISNSDENLRKRPSFTNAKTYLDAQTWNTKFYPRLKQGITILDMRAFFLSAVMTTKKEVGRAVTNEDLKSKFVAWYETTESESTLVTNFTNILDKVDANPEEYTAFSEDFDDQLKHIISPAGRKVSGSIMLVIAFGLCMKKGKKWLNTVKAAQQVIVGNRGELVMLNRGGGADTDEEIGVDTQAEMLAEEEHVLGFVGKCTIAIGVLAGIASIIFAGLEAAHAADTEDKLTDAIKDAKDALTTYYTDLVEGSNGS